MALAIPPSARPTEAWVASSLEKIRPAAVPGSAATAATLSAARNEFEAFQIAVAGPASGVTVTATPLSGPATLPAPRLFREEIIHLVNASGPDGATGPFPDAMIPDVDEVVGEHRTAFPFDAPAGENRVIWVESHVPADATPGLYHGTVTVHASGQADVVIPVTLTVWDFALPSRSSLRSHFGLYWGDLVAAHGLTGDALSALRARYAQLGLDHRISLGAFDDGNADLSHFATFYGPLIDGTAATQLPGAQLTAVQYMGPVSTAGYATWAAFFKSKGWFDRLFDYTCDEPPQTCQWADIPARNATMKAADPAFRSLVTTDVAAATSNGVVSSIDILVPVVNYMYDKPGMTNAGLQRASYDAFLAAGAPKELWMYQSCMSHGCSGTSDYFSGWVSYAIDASAVRGRGMEWLSFLYGATGELYWDATYAFEKGDAWADQWFFGGNGDGTLFYPGTVARIGGQTDIPVASLRLKMIREGMEDFEYLEALSAAGDPTLARQLAGTLFANPWTQPSAADLLSARDRIAHRIQELSGKPTSYSDPVAAPIAASAPVADPVAAPLAASAPVADPVAAPIAASAPVLDPAAATSPPPAPSAVSAPVASAPAPVTAPVAATPIAPGPASSGADAIPSAIATAAATGATPVPTVVSAPSIGGQQVGGGCAIGGGADAVAALGTAVALLVRRRRRAGGADPESTQEPSTISEPVRPALS